MGKREMDEAQSNGDRDESGESLPTIESGEILSSNESVPVDIGSGVLDLFPRMTYKPWVALGEYVDNSIQSFYGRFEGDFESTKGPVPSLKAVHGDGFKLKVEILADTTRTGRTRIIIRDNAAGISTKDAQRAFRLGVAPDDRQGLSQYGIGMKSASLWFARRFTIVSSAIGEDVERTVKYDRASIVRSSLLSLPVEVRAKQTNVHGTTIVLEDLHHPVAAGATIGRIKNYLSSVYRDFLREGLLELVVQGEKLSYAGPQLLRAKYWSASREAMSAPMVYGPMPNSPERTWKKLFEFALDESWAEQIEDERPESPPVVRGWVGIMQKGEARSAGLVLLWRHKVVTGAGAGVESADDQYKPPLVFGAPNSFASQRLVGEVDVSEIPVSPFKDSLAWNEDAEAEFAHKLHKILKDGDESILSMMSNYRPTSSGKNPGAVKDAVDRSLRGATSHVDPDQVAGVLAPDVDAVSAPEAAPARAVVSSSVADFRVPRRVDARVTLEVKEDDEDLEWLRVIREGSTWRIVMNRSHPFMNSFVSLPGADIDPVVRIATALGLAEVSATNAGVERPHYLRLRVNELLRGALGTRGVKAAEDE